MAVLGFLLGTLLCPQYSPNDGSPYQGGEYVGGEVGAGVAALDEARPIVADDHLLPLAVHPAERWTPRGGKSASNLFKALPLQFCDNNSSDR